MHCGTFKKTIINVTNGTDLNKSFPLEIEIVCVWVCVSEGRGRMRERFVSILEDK